MGQVPSALMETVALVIKDGLTVTVSLSRMCISENYQDLQRSTFFVHFLPWDSAMLKKMCCGCL